ncbi:hypothetical protein Glove_26g126 [Diversispora epigaea]|uniref:Uncharacterized protein n=1 Tax=Diversispora epigaea TaxID=1348612 RepID=A0A397JKE6_9GLOM|nr:hypothetical protein Glove_26g126 [Diversispora epigaea]
MNRMNYDDLSKTEVSEKVKSLYETEVSISTESISKGPKTVNIFDKSSDNNNNNEEDIKILQHKRALELLQEPGQKEYLEECATKAFNITALKEWEEAGKPFEEDDEIIEYFKYKKIEAYKNGVNIGLVDNVIRTRSAGTGEHNSFKSEEHKSGNISRIYPHKNSKTRKKSSTYTSKEHLSSTTDKNDKYCDKNSRPKQILDSDNAYNQNAYQFK